MTSPDSHANRPVGDAKQPVANKARPASRLVGPALLIVLLVSLCPLRAWSQQQPAARRAGAAQPQSAPTSTVNTGASVRVPLPGPQVAVETPAGAASSPKNVTASLAIVLGLFFLAVILARSKFSRPPGGLGPDVVEVLGRRPLGPRQSMVLVRAGRKLLLVASLPQSATTLTEITDPDEVAWLVEQCQSGNSAGLSALVRPYVRGGSEDRR